MARQSGKTPKDYIYGPRITEKATYLSSSDKNPVYTFEIHPKANKPGVMNALKELYKVSPIAVRIVNLPRKKLMTRTGVGYKNGTKKAIVTLKKGEKIEEI
ncbi:MAG: 50S ribosomal protein L23 [Candidatus Vogelbacteria bacterium]|nr:50S ribosomal protein L23 [Candidatus Vogelbacteria bacterium]